jgi:hypothetical protein
MGKPLKLIVSLVSETVMSPVMSLEAELVARQYPLSWAEQKDEQINNIEAANRKRNFLIF